MPDKRHFTPGERVRIVRDPHHPERVGTVHVVQAGRSQDNLFGPTLDVDGTRYGYWWGEVELVPEPDGRCVHCREAHPDDPAACYPKDRLGLPVPHAQHNVTAACPHCPEPAHADAR